MAEKMALDDLLAAQSKESCIATVEPVKDEPDMVKITPWAKGVGCLCHLALKIPKAAIESVTPTGDIHYCCGKTLRVVEVQFREDSVISLTDLFAQVMQAAQGSQQGEEPRPFDWRGAAPGAFPLPAAASQPMMPGIMEMPTAAAPNLSVGPDPGSFGMGGMTPGGAEMSPEMMGMAAEIGAPSSASLSCPTGTTALYCGGYTRCMPPGYYCCGGRIFCKTGQSCQNCGGIYQCIPTDSFCCGGRVVCKFGQGCQDCGGIYRCIPTGYYCCGGRVMCPFGYGCDYRNGIYQCVRY